MFEQFNAKQMVALSKQFSDTAFKFNNIAVAGLERAMDVQLKAFEDRFNATVEFWTEAADVRDIEAARKLFPKTVALARDNAEKFYATSQELVGLTVKTGEAIGNLVKGSFEAANEGFVKPVAKKAAK